MQHATSPTPERPSTETIELVDAGARLRLDDHVIDERPWWTRLTNRRRDESIRLTGQPPRPAPPREPTEFPCPACGEPGRTDIHDRTTGRRYLSCHHCFKMWQVNTAPTLLADQSWAMR